MSWIKCTSCGAALPPGLFQSGEGSCSLCSRRQQTVILPALYKSQTLAPPSLPDPPQTGDVVCFFDENRKATQTCSHCGIFMSDAWSARWGRQVVCLKCLEELRAKGNEAAFQTRRTLWDNIALGFSFGPWVLLILSICTIVFYFIGALFLFFTFITAPAAIFVALRYWRAPRSLVPRGRTRLVLAILFALIQIGAWGSLIVLLLNEWGLFGERLT